MLAEQLPRLNLAVKLDLGFSRCPLLSIDMITDVLDAGHLLIRQRAACQRREILLHLVGTGWSGDADVHVGVGEDKAVAVRGGKRRLAGGHVPGLERLAPARGGEDHDARAVVRGQVGKDILFRAPMHDVVAHSEQIDGQVDLAERRGRRKGVRGRKCR